MCLVKCTNATGSTIWGLYPWRGRAATEYIQNKTDVFVVQLLFYSFCLQITFYKNPRWWVSGGGGGGASCCRNRLSGSPKDILSKRKRDGNTQNAPTDTMGNNPQWPLTSPIDATHLLPTTPGRAPSPTAPSRQTNQTRTGSRTLTQLPIYRKYK